MKYFAWNEGKNEVLKKQRNISFEEILVAIENGMLLDIVQHPNAERYKNQKIFIVDFNNYAYLIPFVEDDEKIFMKTIIPSRQMTKKYLLKK